MGETWIGIDAGYIFLAMIFVVGIYVRNLQEKVSQLEQEMSELRQEISDMGGFK